LPGEAWALLGSALLLIGVVLTAIFGRRNARDSSDLARIELLFAQYDKTIAGFRTDLGVLEQKVETLRNEKAEEKKNSDRRIHALREYVSDLLAFIAAQTGVMPPSPREPLD
jgi:hypothetical protein